MAVNRKLIREEGFVLGREIKEATDEFVSRDGVVVPAQPTRYVVHVLTSSIVDKVDGMSYISQLDYKVTKEEYEKFTYFIKVVATFECVATDNGFVPKPVKLELLV